MRLALLAPIAVLLAAAVPAAIAVAAADTSPYRGLEVRAIKALSAQDIVDLRAGKGMAMALAAELNGHPGPRHVLDLAGPLALSRGQTAAVQSLFDAMQAEASALGEAVISAEAGLEHGFRTGSLEEPELQERVMRIAELRGRLRATHLRYHLSTRALLDRHQLMLYDRLRGYGDGAASHGHRH